jgi:RNA polymerase sigma factor (sigma-70 family)
MSAPESSPGPVSAFATTQWTLVLHAGRPDSPDAARALAALCTSYWYPLYAFVRRQGHSAHDAQDLTQEFFARLLEKNYLAHVSREKGRFRSFLLAALKNFLANEWDKVRAQKRGGDRTFVPLDATTAETRYAIEPVDALSADKIFERRWALTLLDRTIELLRAEHVKAGRGPLFDELKGCLTGDGSSLPYAELATRFQTTEGAIKVAVHRLRQRYRDVLRAEVANTVAQPGDVDDELRQLFAALSG